mgnify:CR=1 FL=1
MATAVEAKIDDALLARLAALTFSPAIPVAYPNVAFTPPAGRHFRAFIFRNPTDRTAFRTRVLNGIMQVSVYSPLNEGPKPADELAGAIVAHFDPSLPWLTSEGVTVRMDPGKPPYAGSAMRDPDAAYWMVPVTINWFAQINS